MAVHEDNCIIKYTTWPAAGTTIDNEMGAAALDGTAADNDYKLLPSGYTAFDLNDATDKITIDDDAAIDKIITGCTWEYLFKPDASASTRWIWSKPSASGNTFYMYIGTDGSFAIMRYDDGAAGYRCYSIGAGSIVSDAWNFLQISWDMSVYNATPVIKINDSAKVVGGCSGGATDAWIDDSGYDLTIMNRADGARDTSGDIALFRLHNAALSSADLTDNYTNDWGRAGNVHYDVTKVPGCVADEGAVTFIGDASPAMSVPGCVADDVTMTSGVGVPMSVLAAVADDVDLANKVITLPMSVPDSIATSSSVTSADVTITPHAIGCITNDVAMTGGVGVTMSVPNAVADDVDMLTGLTLPMSVPAAVADVGDVTIGISILMSVPDAVADDVTIDGVIIIGDAIWHQIDVPNCDAAVGVASIVITLPMSVPACVADDVVVTAGLTLPMSSPTAIADEGAVTFIGDVVIPMSVPDAVVDDVALTIGIGVPMSSPDAVADEGSVVFIGDVIIPMSSPDAVADDVTVTTGIGIPISVPDCVTDEGIVIVGIYVPPEPEKKYNELIPQLESSYKKWIKRGKPIAYPATRIFSKRTRRK